jgi:pimeloyl-ACP methyl ester carboxylesterase
VGQSQPAGAPVEHVTVEQMADDAEALMQAAGWQAAHVVGHSLGGLIALQLALSAPHRVRSLSLLCTFASGRDAAPATPRMIWLGARSRIGTRKMRRKAFLQIVLPPQAFAESDPEQLAAQLAPVFGHDLADQPPIVTAQLLALRAYDATPRLGELAGLPTLVVSAVYDPIAPPRIGRHLADGIPGAHYVEVPDASHGLPIHDPERVNALLLEHFKAVEEAQVLRQDGSV